MLTPDALSVLIVHGISQHADLHVRPRDGGQLEGARETFVALRVIVFQGDLGSKAWSATFQSQLRSRVTNDVNVHT